MYALLLELLDPFLLLMLALGLGLVSLWWKPGGGRRRVWLVTVAFALLWIASTPLAAFLSLRTVEGGYPPLEKRPENVQAIVVLGGSVRPPNARRSWTDLERDTLMRCVEAERLYRRGPPVLVVVSGGKVDESQPGPTLAAAMAAMLRADGIDNVVEESHSKNTYENAVESARILRSRGINRCVLVSDSTHLRRATACFEAQEIDTVPAGAYCRSEQFRWGLGSFLPDATSMYVQRVVLHEWLGILWYKLCGRF